MLIKKSIYFFVLLLLSLCLIGCNDGGKMEDQKVIYSSLKDVPASAWKKLSSKKIYFGHQSVGNDIIAGINDLMKDNPQIKLNILESADEKALKNGAFIHNLIGKNENPESKISAFDQNIKDGIGNNVEVAGFKFCFVDVNQKTDAKALFDKYQKTLAELKTKYPKTTFVHFTVPLLKKEKKSFFKKLIGKSGGFFDDAHNVVRNQLNNLILHQYDKKEPIFDIAKVESTLPDGTRESFSVDGKTYFSLVSDYTEDGGHLNELGRRKVAEQFLIFLVNL